MIVLLGASGNVGGQTASLLLDQGEHVRVIGRSEIRLRDLMNRGAEAAIGSALDFDFLYRAFEGASSIFVMMPNRLDAPNLREFAREYGEVLAHALRASKTTHVVHLSSHGAHHSSGVGPIKCLHDQEQRLNNIQGLNVLHLRPTWFMENLYTTIPLIKKSGVMGNAIRGDLRFAMIATRDIAPVAAGALSRKNFTGIQIRELLGERDVTLNEVARVFGALIGKPEMPYVPFSYEDMREWLLQAGIAENPAKEMVELARAINEKRICVAQPRNNLNTTPTSIETFAPSFSSVYHAS